MKSKTKLVWKTNTPLFNNASSNELKRPCTTDPRSLEAKLMKDRLFKEFDACKIIMGLIEAESKKILLSRRQISWDGMHMNSWVNTQMNIAMINQLTVLM